MKKTFRLLLLILFSASQIAAQRAAFIEDTIAGITVGKSTFADVQHKFRPRLIVDQGRQAVRWDGQCEIFFDFEPYSPRPNDRVQNVQFLNLGKGAAKDSPCNRLATGRGLRLSDSPQRARALYGPTKQSTLNNNFVLGYNTKPNCPDGSKRAVILHNFGVEWIPGSSVFQNIYLGITFTSCPDLP